MVDELPDASAILESTDWSRLEHAFGSADPETPVKLAGLMSGEAAEVTAALDHLWDELLHQGSLYSATPAAALYVAAVLGDSKSREFLSARHRSDLLGWISESVYSVSFERVKQIEVWSGPGVVEENPLFGEMRAVRTDIFRCVLPCTFDSDKYVSEAALLAVIHLLDAPELKSHVGVVAPRVRGVLAVSSNQGYRNVAISRLAAWGEDVESLKHLMGPKKSEEESWNDFWNSDRGSLEESPF
jgi:hypothetical protein